MSYVFFASYRREMIEHPPFAEAFRRFLADLTATVKINISGSRDPEDEMYFLDTENIELGTTWPDELQTAVTASKLCLAFFYPGYFKSEWCGQEFEFFHRRGVPIIPVRWLYAPNVPAHVGRIQIANGNLPQDYWDRGLQPMMLMPNDRSRNDYQLCVQSLAKSISDLYQPTPVSPTALTLRSMPGWEAASPPGIRPPTAGNISKTAFAFIARDGWDWTPYPANAGKSVGAMALTVSGELGLRYEEIPCDANFDRSLRERKSANVPTVLLTDPASVSHGTYKDAMKDYDNLYLLNCGALLAWPDGSANTTDANWDSIQRDVCPQKTTQPPPFHEWRSIFSQTDLRNKTVAVIEGIRGGLLKTMLQPGSNVPVRKAENPQLTSAAASQGISLATAAQISGSAQPQATA